MSATKQDRKRSRLQTDESRSAPSENAETDAGTLPSRKKARVEERRSIFVRSLPPDATNETLTDFFSEHFPVKHATVVVDQKTKESRGYGFVTFADAEDAAEAKKALDKKKWNGRNIRIDIAEPRHRSTAGDAGETAKIKPEKPEFQAAPKLIIRNLPWSIKTSEQLTNLFRSFGKVKFADLPQTKGKLKGFGFVTIRGKKNAEKALEAINGKEIDGRTLAVDWAVDKQTWEQQNQKDATEVDEVDADEDDVDDVDDEDDDDDDDDEVPSDEADESTLETKNVPSRDDELQNDLDNFFKNHMQNLEDEDEEEEEEKEEEKPRAPRKLMTDNSATVFIRNLPFTTTDESLKAFFAHFGNVRYARVVVDKATDKPAGTGFVCFYDAADAKECIKGAPRPNKDAAAPSKQSILHDESADPDGKYTLDGRLLQVAQAVNKETADHLASDSLEKRREKDKRRLYLLGEGGIGRGSPLFDLLTPVEIQMRQASAAQRRKLVQSNPSLHVSMTRIALRNMPRNIGQKELKELARKAVVGFAKDVKEGRRQPLSKEENARDGKDAKEKERERKAKGKGIVRQAKVVFESVQGSKVPEKSGAGKSRGYGFVEYVSHHWALMGLRYLNGLQVEGDNGRKQRLIAEFAIENAQVVQRRRAAEAKTHQGPKNEGRKNKDDNEDEKDDNKAGRGGLKRNSQVRGRHGQKGAGAEEPKPAEDGKPVDPKAALQQTLITRKKLMRKKKAQARSKS